MPVVSVTTISVNQDRRDQATGSIRPRGKVTLGSKRGLSLNAGQSKTLTLRLTKAGRKALAEATGLSESRILTFVNMADLFRIKGVAGEYAELLVCAGVDTVKELKTRNAANLATKLAEVNAEKKLTRQVPSEKTVADWIQQAGELPGKIEH